MLIDSHAHLDAAAFDEDRDQVMARARDSGIGAIVSVGCDLESSQKATKLAQRYGEVFAAVGFHPHDASRLQDGDLDTLAQLCQQPKVVAIGEVGLDFYRDRSPRQIQIQAFGQQLQLVAEMGLPVIVHSRNAAEETFAILKEWLRTQPARDRPLGVIHCFSGDTRQANRYFELGFLVSFAGPVTYPQASRLMRVVRELPLEVMLVETDCPLLTPQGHRPGRNEPSYLSLIVDRIAEIKGIPVATVAEKTAQNAAHLFRLPSL